MGKICEGDYLFSDEHACILRIVYCLIVLSACRCHGLSLLELTLQFARHIAVTPQFNLSFSFVSRVSKHLTEFSAIESE